MDFTIVAVILEIPVLLFALPKKPKPKFVVMPGNRFTKPSTF